MLKRFIIILGLACFSIAAIHAQELEAKISVNASRVGSTVDKKVFQTLQNALNTFLNTRKWTSETFQTNEKVVCNFQIDMLWIVNDVRTPVAFPWLIEGDFSRQSFNFSTSTFFQTSSIQNKANVRIFVTMHLVMRYIRCIGSYACEDILIANWFIEMTWICSLAKQFHYFIKISLLDFAPVRLTL